jgi:hypothetical protein
MHRQNLHRLKVHGQLTAGVHTSPLRLGCQLRFELPDAHQQLLESARKPSVLGEASGALVWHPTRFDSRTPEKGKATGCDHY